VIDHLVYGTSDLAATVDELGRRLGVSLTFGGQHLGLGTRNYLAALGNGAYLEVIGPDPDQPAPDEPWPFDLSSPRLVTWAARVPDLAAALVRARSAGHDPGPALSGARTRADGVRVEWQVAFNPAESEDGLVPFLIDWGSSRHPSQDAVAGVELLSLTGTHPEPDRVLAKLSALGEELPVTPGQPGLRAELRTPAGDVVLT